MAFVFRLDASGCLSCGVCMDVCPVRALDMTRTGVGSIGSEGRAAGVTSASATPSMMEFPVQVDECIGCEVCETECPTSAITITRTQREAPLAAGQGPIHRGPHAERGWAPLSAYTRESLKAVHGDPWGALLRWRTAKRGGASTTWRSRSASEADRVHAPCQEACPVGTDAGLYVALVADGRDAEALVVASDHNPFPSVCGRVCTAPCEVACRRGTLDEPIAIRPLKRFAADHGMAGYRRLPFPERRHPERVAIVGAGPTGLSAAHLLARGGYGVTVFEAMPVAGGMMAIGIPEHRLPKRVLQEEVERILALGVELRLNTALGRDITLDALRAQGYAAILLATGASKSQRLGVPGEDAEGVWPATLFLKRVNLGWRVVLSGDAVVVGGGSTAMDAARTAWRAGARSVRVLYRGTRGDMPAQRDESRAAEHEGVVIDTLVAPVEILRRNGWMIGVRCVRLTAAGRDADGRGSVTPVPGSEFTIDATCLMIAVGEAPDPSILPAGSSIQIAQWGGLVVSTEMLTAQPGIFAAGDIATGPRSVIDGVAQGQRAAWAIDRYLRKLPLGPYVAPWRGEPGLAETAGARIDLANRVRADEPLARVRLGGARRFAEVVVGFDESVARAEARRCLRCDFVAECPTIDVIRTSA